MSTNTGELRPNEQALAGPRKQEMALYDSLSPRMRRLIDEAPIRQQVLEFCRVIRLHEEPRAYELICELWEREYVGWKRPHD